MKALAVFIIIALTLTSVSAVIINFVGYETPKEIQERPEVFDYYYNLSNPDQVFYKKYSETEFRELKDG